MAAGLARRLASRQLATRWANGAGIKAFQSPADVWCGLATETSWTGRQTTADQKVWLQTEEPSDLDDGDEPPWGEGMLRLGATTQGSPTGLHFVDVAPVGTLLTPGRVWAMLEGAEDVRVTLTSPCAGEVVEINEEAVSRADLGQWLIAVESDGVQTSMLAQDKSA